MAKISKALAEQLAKKLAGAVDWDEARDAIDIWTMSEFDGWQLDCLTDWVMLAIERNSGVENACTRDLGLDPDRSEAHHPRELGDAVLGLGIVDATRWSPGS